MLIKLVNLSLIVILLCLNIIWQIAAGDAIQIIPKRTATTTTVKPINTTVVIPTATTAKPIEIPPTIMFCLCDNRPGCNDTGICQNNMCGIFRVTKNFWTFAGEKKAIYSVYNYTMLPDGAYHTCSYDFDCVFDTMRTYIQKHKIVVDVANNQTCIDYDAIFERGDLKCGGEEPFDYADMLWKCNKRLEIETKQAKDATEARSFFVRIIN